MSLEILQSIFTFVGGLGMFLYGMNTMADGLQKAAGNRMKQLLGILTNNRVLAVLVGALVTAIIQSSSATTVMIVGFVNAGLMNLSQAVGVIMGANIGTTVTSWLVSMNEWGAVLKPEFFAPLLIGVGAFVMMFSRKEKQKEVSEILIGFGVLFIGLSFMSNAIKPYSDSPVFYQAFRVLGGNPVLGILVGAGVTALIQSSSASVGILQTLATTGMVNWNSAVFITLGQNIGTCVTALISSAGANKTAKRAATIHLLFNTLGAIIFGIIMFIVFQVFGSFGGSAISTTEISIFHTVFNVCNTLLLFPFANKLVKLSGLIIKESAPEAQEDETEALMRHLDKRLLETPSFALQTAVEEILRMGEIATNSVSCSIRALLDDSRESAGKVFEYEKSVDIRDNVITSYLVKITNLSLTEKQQEIVNHMFYTVSNIERVSDHAENIAELAMKKIEHRLKFSEEAREEMEQISTLSLESFQNAIMSRKTENTEYIRKVVKMEDAVDSLEEELREKHITRLSQNLCNSEAGVIFIDTLVNLERISDHSLNIANYVKDEMD